MYFKIIKDNKIIDVGSTFVKWSKQYKCFYGCSGPQAQCIFSSINMKYYYDNDWLIQPPISSDLYTTAKIIDITEQEYDELLELLDNNEDINNQSYEEEQQSQPEENNQQHIMTINEMREKILEQENQIKILTNYILKID